MTRSPAGSPVSTTANGPSYSHQLVAGRTGVGMTGGCDNADPRLVEPNAARCAGKVPTSRNDSQMRGLVCERARPAMRVWSHHDPTRGRPDRLPLASANRL